MPKHKRTSEEELDHLLSKIRKLERKVRREKSEEAPTPAPDSMDTANSRQTAAYVLDPSDWLSDAGKSDPKTNNQSLDSGEGTEQLEILTPDDQEVVVEPPVSENGPSTPSGAPLQEEVITDTALDTDALEILGEDPSVVKKLGKDILPELTNRFQHTAIEGLTKETRKELMDKYPIPANCLHIDAPKINPEIKVAIPENMAKRDKGMETKQKQMASAISCLGEIVTNQLNSKEKNKEMLHKLMDLGRLLCDLQHGDSVTRRNFILFSLKKDLKEHLTNTKIDSMLFSETLADTIKSAKTIKKSATDLKADTANKNSAKRPKAQSSNNNLNRKAPGPAYRPPGPPRSYVPAAPRPLPPPQPARASKPWPRQSPASAAPPRRRY